MKLTTLLSVITASLLLSAPSALSQRAGRQPDALTTLTNALERDGFSLLPGIVSITDWAGLYCLGQRTNAGYVNKAPYLLIQVPKSADDPSPVENFKLRPDEAIMLIGPTPPPVKYFGYYGFLATRIFPNGQRNPLVAAFGDAINNATIKTIGPTPFDTPVVLIFTPDQGTDARIRAALRRSGFPSAMINTFVCPASMLNLGDSDTADELTLKVRIGMSDGDPDVLQAYVNSAPTTLTVLRLTPHAAAAANPFPVPPLRVRGTGQTEMDLMNKLNQLRQGIIAAHPGLYPTDVLSKPNFYEAFDYVQQWRNPGADVRDALLFTAGYLPEYDSTNKITLADDEFLVVYGVNHVATGKASYASVNVYASEQAKLSIGQVFHDQFANTAAPYLPAGDPAVNVLYAYNVSRNCGSEPNCLPLSLDYDCPALTINSNTILGIIFRAYLEPATAVGPAMQEILYDRVIKFSPRP